LKPRGKVFQKSDIAITSWMSRNGLKLPRINIGVIFFWFGVLKYFEGLSPAEGIAKRTIDILTFYLFPEKIIITGLATWEILIGIGLLLNVFMRETLLLLFLQMIGTFTPLFLFPAEVFHLFPVALKLEGQYIVKNIVLISAGIVLGATVRGGKLTS
jgi:uncharacterized membrane protein YkgB